MVCGMFRNVDQCFPTYGQNGPGQISVGPWKFFGFEWGHWANIWATAY